MFKIIHLSIKMKSYCLKCREDTEDINPSVSSTINGKAMILSKCAICGSKMSRSKSTIKQCRCQNTIKYSTNSEGRFCFKRVC